MKSKDFEALHKTLLPGLPGFASHKRLLLMVPMQGMLRAVHFDPSAFSKDDFYVAPIVMPLCVPSEHLSLMFGNRVLHPTNGDGWTRQMPKLVDDLLAAVRSQALLFLLRIKSAQDFAELALTSWTNPHARRKAAFVLARSGEYERAVSIIDDLLPRLDLSSHWQKDIFDDSSKLRHMLLNDPDEAQRQLGEWEDYTIRKLGLERFR